MKYAIIEFSDVDFDIYTEQGGFASILHEEGTFKTQYFQESWRDIEPSMMTRSTIKDWESSFVTRETLIFDAIEYMHGKPHEMVTLNELTN